MGKEKAQGLIPKGSESPFGNFPPLSMKSLADSRAYTFADGKISLAGVGKKLVSQSPRSPNGAGCLRSPTDGSLMLKGGASMLSPRSPRLAPLKSPRVGEPSAQE